MRVTLRQGLLHPAVSTVKEEQCIRAARTRALQPPELLHTSQTDLSIFPVYTSLMQMQGGEQTEEKLEEEEDEKGQEESSSALSEPQTPMEVYKSAIYRYNPVFAYKYLIFLLYYLCLSLTFYESICVKIAAM